MTESELINGILQRDRNALTHLVTLYQRQIVKTAYYFTGDMGEAEDITQDVFYEILRSVGTFRGCSGLSTWIYRITVNKSLNHVRRKKRKDLFLNLEAIIHRNHPTHFHPEPSGMNPGLDQKESRMILNRALNALPKQQRTAFILHKCEDLPQKEIAAVMNVSISAVESLIYRAKIQLRRKLNFYFPEYIK